MSPKLECLTFSAKDARHFRIKQEAYRSFAAGITHIFLQVGITDEESANKSAKTKPEEHPSSLG